MGTNLNMSLVETLHERLPGNLLCVSDAEKVHPQLHLSSFLNFSLVVYDSIYLTSIFLGVRFTTYHGHFMLRSTDLLALPAVDSDKAFGMQLSLEETLMTTQTVYFQVALLYPFL